MNREREATRHRHAHGIRVAICLFDGAEELDWAGPWEVLSVWAAGWPEDRVKVFSIATSLAPVTCAKGMRVLPDTTWHDADEIDVLIYPGGRGVMPQLGDGEVRARLQDRFRRGTLMTSVCTGSLVYADAGLLDGRSATTHWSALDDLARLGVGIDVKREHRFVDAGAIITAAGVSAGIDMALYLIARLHSEARARDVRRRIQYDPAPPI
jgi:transcriptional regulator GlxA family with amidase domain